MIRYNGRFRGAWKPERITTLEQLAELARKRKSIAFIRSHPQINTLEFADNVTPASVLINRTGSDLMSIFQRSKLHEYIKPTPIPRPKTTQSYGRKTGKQEGVRRILQSMLEYDNENEALRLLIILEGLDTPLANAMRSEHYCFLPDLDKVKAKLKEMEESQ